MILHRTYWLLMRPGAVFITLHGEGRRAPGRRMVGGDNVMIFIVKSLHNMSSARALLPSVAVRSPVFTLGRICCFEKDQSSSLRFQWHLSDSVSEFHLLIFQINCGIFCQNLLQPVKCDRAMETCSFRQNIRNNRNFMQISRELVRHARHVRLCRCRGNRVDPHLIPRAQPLLHLLYLAGEAANQLYQLTELLVGRSNVTHIWFCQY